MSCRPAVSEGGGASRRERFLLPLVYFNSLATEGMELSARCVVKLQRLLLESVTGDDMHFNRCVQSKPLGATLTSQHSAHDRVVEYGHCLRAVL